MWIKNALSLLTHTAQSIGANLNDPRRLLRRWSVWRFGLILSKPYVVRRANCDYNGPRRAPRMRPRAPNEFIEIAAAR